MPLPSSALTSTEACEEVLRRLGELGAEESASADDVALVKRHLQGVYNEWYGRLIATWPFEQTPPEAMNGFLGVVAARVRPHFQGTSVAQVAAEETQAEALYFRGNPRPEMNGPTKASFY